MSVVLALVVVLVLVVQVMLVLVLLLVLLVLVVQVLVHLLVLFHLSVLIFSFNRGQMFLVQAREPHRWHGDGSQHLPTPSSLNLARRHGLIQRSSHDIQDLPVRGT